MWRLALGVRGLVVCGGLLLGAASIAAHHSFDAEFDRNKPVTVTGVVTRVDWFNPHAHVFVDVKDESGKIVNWDFELAGPRLDGSAYLPSHIDGGLMIAPDKESWAELRRELWAG